MTLSDVTNPFSISDLPTYDEFLGQFVDALQLGGHAFESLREEWLRDCPTNWLESFRTDLAEIESLHSGGAL